jgi:hypothetical protein
MLRGLLIIGKTSHRNHLHGFRRAYLLSNRRVAICVVKWLAGVIWL